MRNISEFGAETSQEGTIFLPPERWSVGALACREEPATPGSGHERDAKLVPSDVRHRWPPHDCDLTTSIRVPLYAQGDHLQLLVAIEAAAASYGACLTFFNLKRLEIPSCSDSARTRPDGPRQPRMRCRGAATARGCRSG